MTPLSLRGSTARNALYSVAEYLSQPILMLFSAPFLLHRLGTEQYAIWVLSSAAVTGAALLSTGFGDAAVKFISDARGRDDDASIERIVRTLLTLNLIFGTAIAIALWLCAPFLVSHLPQLSHALFHDYRQALSLGAAVLVVKSAESVFVCAQRACEHYSASTRIAIACRTTSIMAAVVLAALSHGPVAIMLATLVISIVGLVIQARSARTHLGLRSITPSYDRKTLSQLAGFGFYSWMQGLIALFAGQLDRLLVGYLLGTTTLAYYSICVQAALPIHGVAAAGLQVLFPHIGARISVEPRTTLRRKFVQSLAINIALVLALATPIIFGSRILLTHWMGFDFAAHAAVALSIIATASALLAFNVSGHYFLMAFGRVRLLTAVNLAGAMAMLLAMALLAPRYGLIGAATARLLYGPITWIAYRGLYRTLATTPAPTLDPSALRLCEDS